MTVYSALKVITIVDFSKIIKFVLKKYYFVHLVQLISARKSGIWIFILLNVYDNNETSTSLTRFTPLHILAEMDARTHSPVRPAELHRRKCGGRNARGDFEK